MDTTGIQAAAAAVTGARHLRAARNGQDAAVAWSSGTRGSGMSGSGMSGSGMSGSGMSGSALVVVCDGCSSGASSEVGARLGATLFARALAARLMAGERPGDPNMWTDVRVDVVRALAELLERMPGDRTDIIREHFLFTVIAAAVSGCVSGRESALSGRESALSGRESALSGRESGLSGRDTGVFGVEAAVWAVGDGAYSFGDYTRVLGPFEDNAPPYLAYDLLGEARPAELAIASPAHPRASRASAAVAAAGAIVIATDGACDLDDGLEQFLADKYVAHPDALRRQLAVLARTGERIDWDERRVVRAPASLQDDCAIGVLRWGGAALALEHDARSGS